MIIILCLLLGLIRKLIVKVKINLFVCLVAVQSFQT